MRNTLVVLAALLSGLTMFTASAENLLDIQQLARQHDPVFLGAQARHLAASEATTQSRALLLPSLSLDASTSRNHQEILDSTRQEFFSSGSSFTYTGKSYSLSLNQPLYHRDYFTRLAQADIQVAQADAELAAAEQQLIVRVAQRYFDVLAANDSLDFARAEKRAVERQLEQTRQRFDVGLIAITDVHEAQAEHDLITAREIEADNQLASAREALRELSGYNHGSLETLGDSMPLIKPDPANMERWSDTALQQNMELLVAQFRLQAAARTIELNRAGHYPTFDLSASYSYNDISGGSFGGRETADSVISLQMNLPLYQGGGIQSQVREARFQWQQAQQALEQQRRSTLRQTRDAYRNIVANIKRVQALQQAVVSARSALKATEAGLEVGTRTTVDVLNVRRNLFRAQRDYARARYDYILSSLALKQASGQLVVNDLKQINRWLE